ncbi:universal stress protein [Gemmatimonadota bacterium]
MLQFKNILVVSSSEERDRNALELGLELAGRSGGKLTVANAVRLSPHPERFRGGSSDGFRDVLSRAADDGLQEIVQDLPDLQSAIKTRVLLGPPAMEMVREVMRSGHDLVIKTAGGSGSLTDRLLGSVDMRLLRWCPCPVWIVKGEEGPEPGRILAAVDPSREERPNPELNRKILEISVDLARSRDADLHVLHAWAAWGESLMRSRLSSEEMETYVEATRTHAVEALSDLLRPFEDQILPSQWHLIEGEPEDAIGGFIKANEVGLVVMGTVGRTGIPGFVMGNTAEAILERVECSVLAVKPEGFQTPVELDETD